MPKVLNLQGLINIKRSAALGSRDDQMILSDPENYPVVEHPVDKTDNYIKRCVAVAGETIEIKNDVVYIDGVKQDVPPYSELYYIVTINAQVLDPDVMKEDYNVDIEKGEYSLTGKPGEYRMLLTTRAKNAKKESG
jgi:signal peptidase I